MSAPTIHKEQILNLRSQGKTYNEIVAILKCSLGTISYHLSPNFKERMKLRKKKNLTENQILKIKIYTFCKIRVIKPVRILKHRKNIDVIIYQRIYLFVKKEKMTNITFSVNDVKNKFGANPKCYLTNKPINLFDRYSYEFDHIIPCSRGGTNSLENLGLATHDANQSKAHLTLDEYIALCKEVLINHGYKVEKVTNS